MFKFRKDKLPVVFYDYFISNSCIHNYSTRRKDEYHLNTINSYYGSRKLSSLGSSLWNSLTVEQQNNRNIKNFLYVCKLCFWNELRKIS